MGLEFWREGHCYCNHIKHACIAQQLASHILEEEEVQTQFEGGSFRCDFGPHHLNHGCYFMNKAMVAYEHTNKQSTQ